MADTKVAPKTLKKPAAKEGNKTNVERTLSELSVPLFFTLLCLAGIIAAGLNPRFLINEIITRLARNLFLVLSLIIPVLAGLGLNFGIVIGAMAGQTALIIVTHLEIGGLPGFLLAALISVPFAVFLGWLTGLVLNRAKGREMVTGYILGFFANGVYQLVFLVLVGTLIPMNNPKMMLPSGIGLRNTMDLIAINRALDRALFSSLRLGPFQIPWATFLVIGLLCLFTSFFTKTKLGQQMRAVGQDRHIAEVSGINVDRTRLIAIIISTVLGAWGQLIYLQNLGTFNTYNSHEQVGMFSIAALLIGGASISRATIWNAIIGVLLFHTLFVVSPLAGQRILGVPQVGEYFRSFLAYGVIAVALALHAWQSKKQAEQQAEIQAEQALED